MTKAARIPAVRAAYRNLTQYPETPRVMTAGQARDPGKERNTMEQPTTKTPVATGDVFYPEDLPEPKATPAPSGPWDDSWLTATDRKATR